MKPRHEARMRAVQFLFQLDFNRENIDAALQEFWREREAKDRFRKFTEMLINGVLAHRNRIDDLIEQQADNWDLQRMAAVDRNIMRVAVFELLCCPETPPAVAINEAVELAKEMNSVQSGRFVNGILDKIRESLKRAPHRGTDGPAGAV